MIARYSRKEMASLWTDQNRFLTWLKVEWAVSKEMARQKRIPRKQWSELDPSLQKLMRQGGVDPTRVAELEKVTRHDVIAFTTAVAEKVGPVSRYVHFGLTSSDVVDTGLALVVQQAGQLLLKDVDTLLIALEKQAKRWKDLPTIGRTHGMFAEPTSFGLKFMGWVSEWQRNKERLSRALEGARYGKLSGAVGANSHIDPLMEERILKELNLKREPSSTQVLPRDRFAELFSVIAICGASMERIAVELRHLQRSEVGEVYEGFRKGQKGSSAMPHKRNPISSENLTGCARLLRSYAQAALENVALWHERDISHSAVERVIFPDGFILLDYALQRLSDVIVGLDVRKERVKENLQKAGPAVFSGHYLLALVEGGATREDAYAWVQRCALDSAETGNDFITLVSQHPEISKILDSKRIREIGSLKYQLRHVPAIFDSVLKKQKGMSTSPNAKRKRR